MTQEERISNDVETCRKVILVLANNIKREAKKYLRTAELINNENIEPFDESYVNQLEIATYNLIEAIKTAQMFHKYKSKRL